LNFRKFRKNAKALSPVIATIILIAVTVAVSVVVAAWMGALTIGFMGNSEQASITSTSFGSDTTVLVTVQNTGSATVNIASVTIDGKAASVTAATVASGTQVLAWTSGQVPINKGCSVQITITAGAGVTFVNSAQYTIQLQTAKGNSLTTSASYSS
jgi:flagellin-like protein